MRLIQSLIGGFAGAIALNLLHETARRIDPKAPRVDLLGEQALTKSLDALEIDAPQGRELYLATLAADVLSNGIYFAAIGGSEKSNLIRNGLATGIIAGLGAIKLPEPLGLDDAPVNRSQATQLMTVAWYTIGGLVAAIVIKKLR